MSLCCINSVIMEVSKEDLKGKSLQELKILAKSYGLKYGGTKTQIIKSIVDHTKPDVIVVHSHPSSLASHGYKIIGLKLDEHDKRVQVGKERDKGKVKLLYYSMGVHYYEVRKDFEFI
jgi:hypothetical protein